MQISIDPLTVNIKTTRCDLPGDQRNRLQPALTSIAEHVNGLPDPELELHVAHHSQDAPYSAELRLRLPGRSLFTREKQTNLDDALLRGLSRLERKLVSYLESTGGSGSAELAEAKRREEYDENLVTLPDPEDSPLADAVVAGDYRAFRKRLADFDIWLNKRVGRRIQRLPQAEAALSHSFVIGDVVEEVYLNAFDAFMERSKDVRLSEWLDGLIDPSIRALLEDPDEREAVSYARSFNEGDEA